MAVLALVQFSILWLKFINWTHIIFTKWKSLIWYCNSLTSWHFQFEVWWVLISFHISISNCSFSITRVLERFIQFSSICNLNLLLLLAQLPWACKYSIVKFSSTKLKHFIVPVIQTILKQISYSNLTREKPGWTTTSNSSEKMKIELTKLKHKMMESKIGIFKKKLWVFENSI